MQLQLGFGQPHAGDVGQVPGVPSRRTGSRRSASALSIHITSRVPARSRIRRSTRAACRLTVTGCFPVGRRRPFLRRAASNPNQTAAASTALNPIPTAAGATAAWSRLSPSPLADAPVAAAAAGAGAGVGEGVRRCRVGRCRGLGLVLSNNAGGWCCRRSHRRGRRLGGRRARGGWLVLSNAFSCRCRRRGRRRWLVLSNIFSCRCRRRRRVPRAGWLPDPRCG